jgi:dethiobiotin synthase
MTPIFVAATGQNAGKTTTSMGLLHFFQKHGVRVGFMKPVGQRFRLVDDVPVDEDSVLMKSIFGLEEPLRTMSPVAVPRGFTTEYVHHREKYRYLANDILEAFQAVGRDKDMVIIEGTGHAGVGSIFDLSNATVARMLGAKVIVVSEGGIGSAFDEIVLNTALFEKAGVQVIGAVVNKVHEEKYERVKEVVAQALVNRALCPIAFLPFQGYLSSPNLSQIADKLGAEFLCGSDAPLDYVENIVIAGMEPQNVIPFLAPRTLVITPGDRVDNILVAISSHLMGDSSKFSVSGILLTHGFKPHQTILELLRRTDIPVLLTPEATYAVASQVYSMSVKTQAVDGEKIDMIKEMVERHMNADCLLPGGNTCRNCGGRCALKSLIQEG